MAKKKPRKPNAEYVLQPKDLSATTVRVLSLDPGSRNMGIACVGATADGKVRVLANSILTNPITHLTSGFKECLDTYLAEIDQWIKLYQPRGLVIERFQTRGTGGPLIELVSVMIGALCAKYPELKPKLVVASQWKNAFNRRFGENSLNELYNDVLVAPHQLDATLIGCYGLEIGLRKELRYEPKSIIVKVETSSCLDLRKRRNK